MKKIGLLAFIALFTMSLSVSAQNRNQRMKDGNRNQRQTTWNAKTYAETMKKELNLTDAQTAKVEALMEKKNAEVTQRREAAKARREKNREEMKTLREKEFQAFNSELEGIIGKEKAEQWKTSCNDKNKNRKMRKNGRGFRQRTAK